MGELAGDVEYQQRFRRAFVKRRLHPSTELRVWEYVTGRPKEQIEMSAKLSMDARLEAERQLFATLTIEQMEELAAESQALVDKMTAMAQANAAMRDPPTSPRGLLTGETTDVPPRGEPS
jgi:hypothetical protein